MGLAPWDIHGWRWRSDSIPMSKQRSKPQHDNGKDKTIGIIFPMFWPITDDTYKQYGGLEPRTTALAKYFADDGYKVKVLAPKGSHLSHKNIRIYNGDFFSWNGKEPVPYSLEKNLVECNIDVLKQCDVVLEDNHFGFFRWLKSCHPDEYPLTVNSWDHHPDNLTSLPNYPQNIITVSKWTMSALREKFKHQNHKFWHAYSGLIRDNYPEDFDLTDKEDNLWLFLARFSAVKGPDIIIELAKQFKDDNFILLGDVLFSGEGHYVRTLKEVADSLDNVKIIFNASYNEKIEYLKRCSGLLHPGRWCIPPYEAIITEHGMVQISDIDVGDKVLTNDGTFQKVKNKFSRHYDGNLIRIQPRYSSAFDVTEEHKVMTLNGYKPAGTLTMDDVLLLGNSPSPTNNITELNLMNEVEFPKAELVKEKTNDGSSIIFRSYTSHFKKTYEYTSKQRRGHPFPEYITIDDDFLHLCAAYITEGISEIDYLGFAIGKEEYCDIWERISKRLHCNCTVDDRETWYNISIHSRVYPQIFAKWFAKGAKNKRLPHWIWDISDEHKRTFLLHLIHYDGHSAKYNEYSTSSKTLAYQIKLLAKSLGIIVAVNKTTGGNKTFNGKTKYYEGGYKLRFYDCEENLNFLVNNNDERYVNIYKIDKLHYEGTVYDIEVEHNHNFNLNSIVVSNSEPLGWNLLEGLYFGSKLLAFDRGSIREVYHHEEHGAIVPFSNDDGNNIEMYKRSFRSFKNMKIKPGVCRQRILDNFDFKKLSFPIYKEVMLGIKNENPKI